MIHPAAQSPTKRLLRTGSLWLLAGLMAMACVTPDFANAQLRSTPQPGKAAPPAGGAKKAGGKKAAPTAKVAVPDEPVDPNKLPAGYIVPPEPPEWLTTSDEWIFEPFDVPGGDEKTSRRNFNAQLAKFNALRQKGELGGEADRRLISDMLECKLSRLTRKENREQVYKLRNDIYNDILGSGNVRGTKREVRAFMLQTIADKAPKLFDYHFAARINGAILLADLSDPVLAETEGDTKTPPVRCTRAAKPLMDLLRQVDDKNRKQPDAVRVWAVDGLVRIGTIPDLRQAIRNPIVDVLAEQMAASTTDHDWLQWRLAEALGNLGILYNSERKPIVAQVLAEVLVDQKRRSPLVRAEAAQSLGKLPLDPAIDLGLIAHEIARLAQQMADEYRKKPDRAMWQLAFLKLYLAFKPANDDDAKGGKGLLTQIAAKGALVPHKKTVQDAFDVVLPIVQKVVMEKPQSIDEQLTKLKEWLEKNPPRKTSIADNLPPIIEQPRS